MCKVYFVLAHLYSRIFTDHVLAYTLGHSLATFLCRFPVTCDYDDNYNDDNDCDDDEMLLVMVVLVVVLLVVVVDPKVSSNPTCSDCTICPTVNTRSRDMREQTSKAVTRGHRNTFRQG